MASALNVSGDVEIVLDPVAIHELVEGEGGPVVRDLLIRGERVKVEAIRLAPRKSGNLADHIVKRLGKVNGHTAVLIGPVNVKYSLFVSQGTSAHIIRAKNAPKLVFFWAKAGKVVSFTQVNHPGTKPNRYLIRALAAAA